MRVVMPCPYCTGTKTLAISTAEDITALLALEKKMSQNSPKKTKHRIILASMATKICFLIKSNR